MAFVTSQHCAGGRFNSQLTQLFSQWHGIEVEDLRTTNRWEIHLTLERTTFILCQGLIYFRFSSGCYRYSSEQHKPAEMWTQESWALSVYLSITPGNPGHQHQRGRVRWVQGNQSHLMLPQGHCLSSLSHLLSLEHGTFPEISIPAAAPRKISRVQKSNEPQDSQACTNQGRIAVLVYHIL